MTSSSLMASGDEHNGPDGVGKMLHYMYQVAFDADAELTNYMEMPVMFAQLGEQPRAVE